MSATTETPTTGAPIQNTVSRDEFTFTFKVTEENKTTGMTVALNERMYEFIQENAIESPQWRGVSQFLNDALVYYLDGGSSKRSAEELIEEVSYSYDYIHGAAITPTLFNEIDYLVNLPHTVWNTKQAFYICAIESYIHNDAPVVERR